MTTPAHHAEDEFCSQLSNSGIILAELDGRGLFKAKDTFCLARLMHVQRIIYCNEDVYLLRFRIDFRKSFSPQYRLSGANITITILGKDGEEKQQGKPAIKKIFPEGLPIEVDAREVSQGNSFTVGGEADVGPSSAAQLKANVTETLTSGATASFKGSRYIHGLVKGNEASWRVYEEHMAKAGIPPMINVAMLVLYPNGALQVKLDMEVRMVEWPKFFGLNRVWFSGMYPGKRENQSRKMGGDAKMVKKPNVLGLIRLWFSGLYRGKIESKLEKEPLTIPEFKPAFDWKLFYEKTLYRLLELEKKNDCMSKVDGILSGVFLHSEKGKSTETETMANVVPHHARLEKLEERMALVTKPFTHVENRASKMFRQYLKGKLEADHLNGDADKEKDAKKDVQKAILALLKEYVDQFDDKQIIDEVERSIRNPAPTGAIPQATAQPAASTTPDTVQQNNLSLMYQKPHNLRI